MDCRHLTNEEEKKQNQKEVNVDLYAYRKKKKRFSRGNKEAFIELFVRVGAKTSHLHPELIFPRTEATKAKPSELSSVVRTPETAVRLALLDFYIHKTCIYIHNPPATSC